MSDWITIGRIKSAYGLAGWVHVHSYTDDPESLFEYDDLRLVRGSESLPAKLEEYREHGGKGWVARFNGATDRNASERQKGYEIQVQVAKLPKLPEGTYYWRDLVGCQVFGPDEKLIGVVTEVVDSPGFDMLRVKADEMIWAIPFDWQKTIVAVDLANKKIVAKVDL